MTGRVVGNLVAFIAMAAWATQFPILAALLERWDPLLMTIIRTLVPAVSLLLVALVMGALATLKLQQAFDIMLLGGVGLGSSTILFVIGQGMTHPVTASVVVSMLPLCSALLGFASGEERPTLRLGVSIFLALAGGTICVLANQENAIELRGGEIFILVGVFLFAWYTRQSLRRLAGLGSTTQAGITMLAASYVAFVVFALTLPTGLAEFRFDAEPDALLQLAWVCMGSLALSMALWFWASRELGVTVAGMHHNMVPFYVVLLSAFFGAEILPGHIIGAVLVVSGAVLVQLPDRRLKLPISRDRY